MNNEPLTPTESIDLLTKATATVQADRPTHAKIQEALNVLAAVIRAAKPD